MVSVGPGGKGGGRLPPSAACEGTQKQPHQKYFMTSERKSLLNTSQKQPVATNKQILVVLVACLGVLWLLHCVALIFGPRALPPCPKLGMGTHSAGFAAECRELQ